jgi:putative tryptophan/tyrosine transport system substrate-binding protein
MRRREIIRRLAAIAAAWPLTVRAQPSRKRVLAVLMPYRENDAEVRARLAATRDEMRKLGWSEGENLRVEERWTGDDLARIEADAAELIRLEPDVIFVTGGRVVPIVQKQTRTIPVVFVGVSDPLGRGLVTSLARPQGNLTGIALSEYSVVTKQVEILKEIAPSITRAGLMFNPDNPSAAFHRTQFEAAAAALGLGSLLLPVRKAAEIETSIESFGREPRGGLVFPSDLTILAHRDLVTAALAKHRLAAIYSDEAYTSAGGLVAYTTDRTEMFRQGASYVARLLRGDAVADLPILQPTRYKLIINLKAAKGLGIEVPLALQAQADEVIE